MIRAPDGYQIEVLPKVAKAIGGGDDEARELLIKMLRCLGGFVISRPTVPSWWPPACHCSRYSSVNSCAPWSTFVKRGLRSDYNPQQDNLFAFARQVADGNAPATQPSVAVIASLRSSTSFLLTGQRTVCCTRHCDARWL